MLAKFGLGAEHVAPDQRLCHPASAPGRRWPPSSRGVNLLVLDEPTNHLDLPAIEQIEQALGGLRRHPARGLPRPGVPRRVGLTRTIDVTTLTADPALASNPFGAAPPSRSLMVLVADVWWDLGASSGRGP